jgi:Tfp pilus assembly protein PilE
MPHACPDCGAPVSERAAVCPQCGFPIRRDGVPFDGPGGRPGSSSGKQARVLIIALVAGGLFMVMVVGVLAALAIPRLKQLATRATEMQGELLLRQAYALQQTYWDEKGTYASTVDDLREVGWKTPPATYSYDVQVSTASARSLCLEAVPRLAAAGRVRALSMDAAGTLYRDAGCTGQHAVDGALDTRRSDQAEELVRQGWLLVDAYRRAHGGRPPATLAELGPKLEAEAARWDYRMGYRAGRGGYCLTARPLRTVEGPERSVDENGEMYMGSACQGTPIDRFDAEPGDTANEAAAEAPPGAESPSSDLDVKPKP